MRLLDLSVCGETGCASSMHSVGAERTRRNLARNGGRSDSCYRVTIALAISRSVDRACVLAIADFTINLARAGTQTHMDLIEALLDGVCEPMPMITMKAAAKRTKRLMGSPCDGRYGGVMGMPSDALYGDCVIGVP